MQPLITQTWNEGFKAGIEKYYPSYKAMEFYSGQLEKKIEGKDMVISDKDIEIEEKQKEIFKQKQQNNTLKWIAGIGIPVTGLALFIVGMLAGRSLK